LGKRSDFDRVPSDKYDTPFEACRPLLRWLKRETLFIEPCVGAGHLAGHLKRAGHVLLNAYDLPDDARTRVYDAPRGVMFITNPPYWGKPNDLHPLIENLSDQAPTWLLMSADWLFNASSGALTQRLRRIVAVGRVKWIPGSPNTGMENTAWLLFDRNAPHNRFFIGRRLPRNKPVAPSTPLPPRTDPLRFYQTRKRQFRLPGVA
jgi:hypothetical protein